MPNRVAIPILAPLVLAAAASAQWPMTNDSTLSFSLTWQEANASGVPLPNPNGLLEPGEHALIHLAVSFTNQFTLGSFSPPIGTFTSGTIRGLGAGFIDLVGASTSGGNANGAWDVTDAVDPLWDFQSASWGTPINGGSRLLNINFGQFPALPGSVNTLNPVPNIWHALWTPASFDPRTVTFTSAPGSASGGQASSVLLVTTTNTIVSAFCLSDFGSVQIPIAPAPASIFLLAPLLLPRSRRRTGPAEAHTHA